MKRVKPAADPQAYVSALEGWHRLLVTAIRGAVRASATLEETIKWGNLVYFSNGPVLFIRTEEERVLYGYWRGKRLCSIEPRLKASGKYELATIELREGDTIKPAIVRRLTREAVALNRKVGNPTLAVR